jgi:hypothetical protein
LPGYNKNLQKNQDLEKPKKRWDTVCTRTFRAFTWGAKSEKKEPKKKKNYKRKRMRKIPKQNKQRIQKKPKQKKMNEKKKIRH